MGGLFFKGYVLAVEGVWVGGGVGVEPLEEVIGGVEGTGGGGKTAAGFEEGGGEEGGLGGW